MPSAVSELKRILTDFNTRYNAKLSAVISRSGIPIAWAVPDDDVHIENFATLAATLLGASEVIYTGMNKAPPKRVVIESEHGMLVAAGVGTKAFVIAMTPARTDEIDLGLDAVSEGVRNVLRGRP